MGKERFVKYALPISIFVFAFSFILLFPFYKYIFDLDSIGYSAIAERVANGNYFESINGLWSPLSSWLAVPFIKAGINTITAFKYINGINGILLLLSTWHLLKKIAIADSLKAIILYTCVPVFLSYCFYELCADFLLLIFFTMYLAQVCSDDFFYNSKRQWFCGIIAAFAYLAKAYFFPFFLAHFIIVNLYYYRNALSTDKVKKLIQNLMIGIGVFIVLSSPWIFALSEKYHYLTYSNAGKWNFYYELHPGTDYTKLLCPPPYADSYNFWDDPWQEYMLHFSPFSSLSTIMRQVKVLCLNTINSLPFFTEISFLVLPILAGSIVLWVSKKLRREIPRNIFICLIAALIMPSGYLLFHLETRYLWILSILCLLIGGYLITIAFNHFQFLQKQKIIIVAVFVASFLIGPILSLKNNVYGNREYYTIARALKSNNVKGKIICNYLNADQYAQLTMANVIAKNQFYTYSTLDFSVNDLQKAINEFGINYYIFNYTNTLEKEIFTSGEIYKKAIKVTDNIYPGMMVLELK